MLETPHVVVGAVLAFKISNPFVSLPLVLLSHLLVDEIPHWNPDLHEDIKKTGRVSRRSKLIILGDVILGLGFGLGIASQALPDLKRAMIIVLASFLAVVADVVEGFYFFLGAEHRWLKNLIRFQRRHQYKISVIPGLLTQLAVILLSLYILRS